MAIDVHTTGEMTGSTVSSSAWTPRSSSAWSRSIRPGGKSAVFGVREARTKTSPRGSQALWNADCEAMGRWIANLAYALVNAVLMVEWLLTGRWARRHAPDDFADSSRVRPSSLSSRSRARSSVG